MKFYVKPNITQISTNIKTKMLHLNKISKFQRERYIRRDFRLKAYVFIIYIVYIYSVMCKIYHFIKHNYIGVEKNFKIKLK